MSNSSETSIFNQFDKYVLCLVTPILAESEWTLQLTDLP